MSLSSRELIVNDRSVIADRGGVVVAAVEQLRLKTLDEDAPLFGNVNLTDLFVSELLSAMMISKKKYAKHVLSTPSAKRLFDNKKMCEISRILFVMFYIDLIDKKNGENETDLIFPLRLLSSLWPIKMNYGDI